MVCRQLVEYELSEDPTHLTLDTLGRRLDAQNILPSRMKPALHTIRRYGNAYSHASEETGESVDSQYTQPCLDSLSVLVGWYVNNYRTSHAFVFTQNRKDWRHLVNAQKQLGIPLSITFFESGKNYTRQEFFDFCRRYASISQTTPLIFLIDREMPSLSDEENRDGLPYRCWGNNVFSFVLPCPPHRHLDEPISIESYYPTSLKNSRQAGKNDFTAFGELFRVLGNILQAVPRPPSEKERRIDAAIPGKAELSRSLELLLQVRFLDSPQLGTEDWPTHQTPFSVDKLSQTVTMKFPVEKKTGKLCPSYLDVSIHTTDFEMQGESQKRMKVPPYQFSELLVVPLIARKTGVCRIYIDISSAEKETLHLGTIPVEIIVEPGVGSPVIQVTNFYFSVDVSPGHSLQSSRDTPLQTVAESHMSPQPLHSGIIPDADLMLKLNQRYLKDPSNKKMVQDISEDLLLSLAPLEAPKMIHAIEPLVEAEIRRNKVNHDTPGGWGQGIESERVPLIMVIVPVVTAVLSAMFAQQQVPTFLQKVLKKRKVQQNPAMISEDEMLQQLTENDISHILTQKGLTLPQAEIILLTKHLKQLLIQYLEKL